MIKEYINLIRVRQWYKNLVVFLAIFFSANILNTNQLYLTIIAFFSLSLVSSFGYVINDLVDLKKDKLHPEKKQRPLASGKVSKPVAIILSLLVLAIGIYLAAVLGPYFLYSAIGLVVLTQIYTLFLKNILIADVLTIATLFVIRAVAGAFAIEVEISPWLILVPFFLAIFLAVGKRHADVLLLKKKASSTREVLKNYSYELTNSLMIISTTLLIISYALYSFLSNYNSLLYTLPFALFVIFRFHYLISVGSKIARHPEKLVRDWQIVIGTLLWVVITALLIYL